MDLNQYANAIASIESAGSGDYQAVGPRTGKGNRAYGRYQVMDFNIGPWTEKYLGERLTPEQFLANPNAQDAVFQGEFGSYVDRFGNPQDAASAWFTGRPLSEGAGRSDILGTTGAGYVQKFNAALGQPQGGNMQPQGLLGTMSTRNAPEEQRTPFFKNPDFWDTLAIGLQGMTLNPNQALIQTAQERIGARRETAQTTAQRNATAAWLESQGLAQLAEGVRSGAISGAQALTMAQGGGGREPTALMQNYEFFLQQGMTPEQALQAVRSGTVVNVGGESSEFRKASDKALATQIGEISTEGLSAQRSLGLVNELDRVLQQAPQGFGGALVGMAGNLGLQLGEGAGAVQAAQAIINRLVPQQRQPGSGPMSDADLELFKQSLPRIINQPEGNRRIIDTLKAIAQYDIERGNIARRSQIGEITPFEALQQIQSLQNPLDWVRSMSTEGVTDQDRDEAMRILLGE